MLNTKTREILGQLGKINPSQIITYPLTTIISGKAIQAFLDLEKLGEEPFEEIGLFDINLFNSIVSAIDDPVITNNDGILTIANERQSTTFGTTNIDIIDAYCRGKSDLLYRVTNNNEKVLSFELSAKELETIKKMSDLLKELSDLSISTLDGEVLLSVTSKEKSSNKFSQKVQGEVLEDVNMLLVMDVIKKLPNSGFNVSIYKSKKGSLVSVFESTGVEGLSVVIAAKANV